MLATQKIYLGGARIAFCKFQETVKTFFSFLFLRSIFLVLNWGMCVLPLQELWLKLMSKIFFRECQTDLLQLMAENEV